MPDWVRKLVYAATAVATTGLVALLGKALGWF